MTILCNDQCYECSIIAYAFNIFASSVSFIQLMKVFDSSILLTGI